MARRSQKTDEKLIQAALNLLPSTGYSGLSMRMVATKAGVNLGMFHYHFKNKEEFIQRVASEFYEAFFQKFTLEIEAGTNPKDQLRKAILTLVHFARDNRRLLLALGKDVLEGDQKLVRMLEAMVPRHGIIVLNLIRECKKQGLIADIPLPIIITFIIGSIAGPIVLMALLEQVKLRQPFDLIKKIGIPFMLTDTVIEQRLDLAFRALAPGMSWKQPNHEWDQQMEAAIEAIVKKSGEKDQPENQSMKVKKKKRIEKNYHSPKTSFANRRFSHD